MGTREAGKGPGRPPKFTEPSRVVTVTLPVAALALLAELDDDRARAIVKATELATAAVDRDAGRPVEMQAVSSGRAVITVPQSPALSAVTGLSLIQIRPSRYLIVLEPGTALTEVEVALVDALEALEPGEDDHAILVQLLQSLRTFRRSDRARTGELILVEV